MAEGSRRTPPVGFGEEDRLENEEMVNDSLGTVDPADSTGTDEEKETGDAKTGNKDTGQED